MTTLKRLSTEESLLTGRNSNYSSPSTEGNIIYNDFSIGYDTPPSNTISIDSLIEKSEADPVRAQYLSDARKELSEMLYAGEPKKLAALRLDAGLSQVKLAALAKISQSHLSLIEQGKNDPGTDLVSKIAEVLDLNPSDVFDSILRSRGA